MGELDRWDFSPATGRPVGTAHPAIECTALCRGEVRSVQCPLHRRGGQLRASSEVLSVHLE